jgi:hypothetical protein
VNDGVHLHVLIVMIVKRTSRGVTDSQIGIDQTYADLDSSCVMNSNMLSNELLRSSMRSEFTPHKPSE